MLVNIEESFFISSVLSAIEGEKDPRNILLCFDLIYQLIRNFHEKEILKPFLEEIFDKVSCYFPINFVPPKNDKFKIKPLELKEKLARCFLASPVLADQCFPFFIDKLSVAQIDTKTESLEMLKNMV